MGYLKRTADAVLEQHLEAFGAVLIEGPKWCGKTWTALNHVSSATYMTEKSQKDLAQVDPKYIFRKERQYENPCGFGCGVEALF